MSTRRERAKEPIAKLNKQLIAADEATKIYRENCKKNLRFADILTDMGKLVFGGVIIGGLFEKVEYPEYLFPIGIFGFVLLMWIGTVYFNKGIKEK